MLSMLSGCTLETLIIFIFIKIRTTKVSTNICVSNYSQTYEPLTMNTALSLIMSLLEAQNLLLSDLVSCPNSTSFAFTIFVDNSLSTTESVFNSQFKPILASTVSYVALEIPNAVINMVYFADDKNTDTCDHHEHQQGISICLMKNVSRQNILDWYANRDSDSNRLKNLNYVKVNHAFLATFRLAIEAAQETKLIFTLTRSRPKDEDKFTRQLSNLNGRGIELLFLLVNASKLVVDQYHSLVSTFNHTVDVVVAERVELDTLVGVLRTICRSLTPMECLYDVTESECYAANGTQCVQSVTHTITNGFQTNLELCPTDYFNICEPESCFGLQRTTILGGDVQLSQIFVLTILTLVIFTSVMLCVCAPVCFLLHKRRTTPLEPVWI